MLKKGLRWLCYAAYLVLTVWALFEVAFRYQWIDFYATEFRALNPEAVLHSPPGKGRVLVLGDSFSAQPFSYVNVLRDSLPAMDILNAAVPGTGIREAECIGADKMRRFPPDILVYQVYVGNDLWDLRKSCDSPHISWLRKMYWRLSDWSLSLRYLNYRLGQFKAASGTAVETRELKQNIPFAVASYSRRERLLLQAEPALIHDSVLAKNERGNDLTVWLEHLDALLAALPARTRQVVLLLVPHCAQVGDFYRKNLETLGATPFDAGVAQPVYPFLTRVQQHFAAQPRVRICSPLTAFQRQDSTGHRLYYENDPHLNPSGHLALGRFVLSFLNKQTE